MEAIIQLFWQEIEQMKNQRLKIAGKCDNSDSYLYRLTSFLMLQVVIIGDIQGEK
jgi:hypothetical protein